MPDVIMTCRHRAAMPWRCCHRSFAVVLNAPVRARRAGRVMKVHRAASMTMTHVTVDAASSRGGGH